jgi:hypothetical protein
MYEDGGCGDHPGRRTGGLTRRRRAPYAEQTCRSCSPLSTARLCTGNDLLCYIKMSRPNDAQKPQGKARRRATYVDGRTTTENRADVSASWSTVS